MIKRTEIKYYVSSKWGVAALWRGTVPLLVTHGVCAVVAGVALLVTLVRPDESRDDDSRAWARFEAAARRLSSWAFAPLPTAVQRRPAVRR
jgi:hypothetical protein